MITTTNHRHPHRHRLRTLYTIRATLRALWSPEDGATAIPYTTPPAPYAYAIVNPEAYHRRERHEGKAEAAIEREHKRRETRRRQRALQDLYQTKRLRQRRRDNLAA